MRPQLIAHFRALNEGSDGFEGTLPSGGRVTCAVRTDLGFVREQAGYLKTRFADTFPADRDVWNAAMMQIELFNTRVECTLAPHTARTTPQSSRTPCMPPRSRCAALW